jgi:hypothetical protein
MQEQQKAKSNIETLNREKSASSAKKERSAPGRIHSADFPINLVEFTRRAANQR